MRWLLICLALAGCARAGKENSIIGGLTDARPRGDATEIPLPDAATPDAVPQTTLTQTVSNSIAVDNSFACPVGSNSYYRVFTLADYSITSTLHVTQIDFGIQDAAAGSGASSQPATVNIGTYGGPLGDTTLDATLIRMINTMTIQIPNGSATAMTVPITADIAPTASVIVELAVPDGTADNTRFFIGTNTDGERQPGYTLEPGCGYGVPTTMQSIADKFQFGNVHAVITVGGSTDAAPN
jgi:hypothetical protein